MHISTELLLVILGLLPSFLWMAYFLRRDPHPEPRSLLAKTFLMGIILSPFAVILQIAFTRIGDYTNSTLFIANSPTFFLWAAFIEEFVKFYAVRTIVLTDPSLVLLLSKTFWYYSALSPTARQPHWPSGVCARSVQHYSMLSRLHC